MAIGNLLDNARKYTPEFGKISVAIYSRHGEVHIEVADTGVGIDPDELDHIFDRFQRATDAVRGNVEGAGLGLYLARRIAELQGGTIEVSSRLGKGTKFVMILPQGDYGVTKGAAS
jgi:signal transduction histidine kinase